MAKFYTTEEVADILHIGVRKIRSYIKEGRLEASKVGRAYLVSEEEVRRFVESCKS